MSQRKFFLIPRTILVATLVIPAIHLCLCILCKSLYFQDGAVALWPSSGVYLTAVILLGYRVWHAIFLSELLANALLFFPNHWFSGVSAAITSVDPIIVGFLINHLIKRRNLLERSEDVFKFVVLQLPSLIVTSALCVTLQCFNGFTPWTAYVEVLRTWIAGGFAGYLIVTPALLAWFQTSVQNRRLFWQHILELTFLFLSIITITQIAFTFGYPLEYMLIPTLIWSAFRFGQRETTLIVVLVSVIAVYGTSHGIGSFARTSVAESLLLLQSFICVIALTTFVLTATLNENKKAAAKLRQINEELEQRVELRTAELREAKVTADSANQAKSEFLANMSHELRTPLNGILGYAQILQRSHLIDKERKAIDVIHQCGSHLLTLINDILDLSKIEARKMELYPKDVHFPSFLQGVVEICLIRAEQKGIFFSYQPSDKLPKGILVDEKRLRQVLINLLGNAIKFTDIGGVTFKVEGIGNRAWGMGQREISDAHCPLPIAHCPIHKIRFHIEDTGTGMSPQQLEKIFLPFEQVGKAEKQAEGTGLGLAISQKVVALMNSTINVQSQQGRGSIFWFDVELPLAEEFTPIPNFTLRSNVIGFKGEKRKILVVDDAFENCSVIVNLLEPIGFEVTSASNGQEGLDKACIQPDLIITDLSMPVMDGLTMVKHLRSKADFQDTIIIASSASVFDINRHQAINAGCNDFLPKPVQVEELLWQLQTHLQLTWIYQNSDELTVKHQDSVATMIIPPSSELVVLYQAAQRCDIADIQAETNRIMQLDTKYTVFAHQIMALVDEFEVEAIATFLEETGVSRDVPTERLYTSHKTE